MDIYIAIDPGVSGAVGAVVGGSGVVFDAPVIKVPMTVKTKAGNKRFRMDYDINGMIGILKPFSLDEIDPVVILEDVHARPGEGTVSSFRFGEGKGLWTGVIAGLFGNKPVLVTPQKWKKEFPELTSCNDIQDWQDEIKALRAKLKVTKDKKQKQGINKDIDKLNRSVKARAKDEARKLASYLFPDIAFCFKLKKHDGRAEALLMAEYAKRTCK
tara:strand:+ start:619 stop:1260 length:642 start_codon:yes stop_codon:yes gene_type:complete